MTSAITRQIFQAARNTLFSVNTKFNFSSLTLSVLSTPTISLVPHELHLITVRNGPFRRVFKKIRGGGRPWPEGYPPPEPRIYGWRAVLPADGKYTTRPLPVVKLGGRHPETGKVVVKTLGGGHKKKFRWVDYKRIGPSDGSTLVERVFQVRYDPCRSARIALVASGNHKRWIIATENMKVGDTIKTSGVIPRMPVKPDEGDAYPVGALPLGTLIHHIEPSPGSGGIFSRAAGTSAQYLRKIDNKCLIQLPSKEQILVDEKCMVVTGRVSNIDHNKIPIGSPNRLRWLGWRPKSGLWHRKDGYCGRKIHPPKGVKDFLQERTQESVVYKLSNVH